MTLITLTQISGKEILINPNSIASIELIENPNISCDISMSLKDNFNRGLIQAYDIRLVNQYHYEVFASSEDFSKYIE